MAEEIKGLSIKFDAEFSDFKKQFSNATKEINATKKESKALADSLKFEWDEKKFVKAQQLAQKAITDTENKAEVLRKRLKQMEEVGIDDKNIDEYRKWQNELIKTETQVHKLKQELEKINNLKLDRVKKQFEDVGQTVSKVGQMMAPISGLAAGVVGGLTAMGKSAMALGGELDDMAMKMDMSAESYQKLQYIAAQTGSEISRIERGFVLLRGSLGKAMQGEIDKSSIALQKLGFTMEEIQKSDPEKMFYETVKRLASIEDQTLQSALATEVFNERVAHDLLPLLRSGADAIDELSAEFETFGVLTNDQVKALAELDDEFLRIKTALIAIKNQIGASLLPVMQSFADFVQEKVIPPIRKMAEWFINLSDKSKGLILGIGSLLTALAPALLVGGKLISGIGNLIPLITKLGGALKFLTGPVGIILGIITLLYSTNEKFRDAINNLIGTLMSTLAPVLTMIGQIFNELITAIQPVITMLGDTLADVINMLMPILNQLLEILMPIVNMIFKNIINQIKQMSSTTKVFMSILQPLITILNSVLGVLLQKVIMPILNEIMSLISGVTNLIKPLIDWVGKLTDKFKNLVLKALKPVADALKFVWDIIKKILGIKDKDLNININQKIDDFALPETTSSQVATAQSALQNTLGANYLISSNYTDNSTKNVTINVTVENYAAEVDIDNMIDQINRKLAEQF